MSEKTWVSEAIQTLDDDIKETIEDMSRNEDWIVSDDIEAAMTDVINKFNQAGIKVSDSYLIAQISGWVSAPVCLVFIQRLSVRCPHIIDVISSQVSNDNNVVQMVIERLVVLERILYLKMLFNPDSIHSIILSIKTYQQGNGA